ncbi:Cytochrome c oxidase assembly factor 6-like [Exaiptasia diaphana]|nr:Cytochrome c oxidase assembly factor 6-like [Exaiptasia diaphana]
MPAPTSEERKKCYEARDKFFACLEVNEGDESACAKHKELYHASCPMAWVKYFARKKVYDEYKKKLNTEGFKLEDSK